MWAWSTPAEAASVSLGVDADRLTVGQRTRAYVDVEDASPTAVPALAVSDGLRVQYVQQSSSQGYTIDLAGKSHMRSLVRYHFEVVALQEGTFTIGPAEVEIGTATMQTGKKTITVSPKPAQAESKLRATAGFDRAVAYEGEVVLYRYELDYQDPVVRSNWQLPDFDGLVPPRDGDRPRNVGKIEGEDGTWSIDRTDVPLVAAKVGKHDYTGAVVTVEIATGQPVRPSVRFDPLRVFGDMMQATRADALATSPASLTIQALPAPPPGFSGLIGEFTVGLFKTDAGPGHKEGAPLRVPVGKSVAFTIEVTGNGTLEGFALPPAAEVDGLRDYDGAPLADATVRDGTYTAVGRYERVLVPTREGAFQPPPVTVISFSPATGAYVTHTVELPVITAVPGEATGGGVASFADGAPPPVATPPEDIRDARVGRARMVPVGALLPVALAVAGLPGVFVAAAEAIGLVVARRRAREKPPPLRPLDRLKKLPEARADRLLALDMALREVLALRARVPVEALDRATVTANLPDALRDAVTALTHDLDRARFGAASDADLVERTRDLVTRLLP